jgi:A/G-specific adenine glycosylase
MGSAGAPRTDVAIAVIVRDGKVLVCRRPPTGTFPNFWEFPGGKREPSESIRDCLRREVREELALDVESVQALSTIDHNYPHRSIRLHPYVCRHDGPEPQLLAAQESAWVDPADLPTYQFPPANEPLIAEVIAYLAGPRPAVSTSRVDHPVDFAPPPA